MSINSILSNKHINGCLNLSLINNNKNIAHKQDVVALDRAE